MTVHSPGSVYCRSNDLRMDFCRGWFWQFFRDFGGAQKYTLIVLSHMPLSSNLTTKQWDKVDKAALHKLLICAGISRDAVKAAIGKQDCGR